LKGSSKKKGKRKRKKSKGVVEHSASPGGKS